MDQTQQEGVPRRENLEEAYRQLLGIGPDNPEPAEESWSLEQPSPFRLVPSLTSDRTMPDYRERSGS